MPLPPGPDLSSWRQLYRWIRTPMPFLDECRARYGKSWTLHLPGLAHAVVMTTDDAVIRAVFADAGDALHAGEANVVLRPFVGQRSILLADGAPHRRKRKLLLPPFHGERMHAYGRTILEVADAAVDRWSVGREFPLHPEMREITLRIIVRTVFGIEGDARFEELVGLLGEALDAAAWPPLLMPIFQRSPLGLGPWARFERAVRDADAILFEEIARRRRTDDARDDILSLLLAARDEDGQPMPDAELRDELVTLLVAGHETTATALTWAFRHLLERRDLEGRLLAELEPAFALGPDALAKLPLLDAVTRETLRLRPVIPIVARLLKQPMRLGDLDLPAGVAIAPAIYVTQRDPEIFDNPNAFDPDRFLRASSKPAASQWFPFGGGVRRCVGMAFALYEMKLVLATVVRRARLRLSPNAVAGMERRSITFAPRNGLPVLAVAKAPRGESVAVGTLSSTHVAATAAE
jgi:cytochrome P450